MKKQNFQSEICEINFELLNKLSKAIVKSKTDNTKIAVISVDVDNFKKVNTVLGSRSGNEMVAMFLKRLDENITGNDLLAHKFGDRFVVSCCNVMDLSGIMPRLSEMINSFRKPFNLGEMDFYFSISAGVSFFPEDAVDAEQLLDNAETALNNAKMLGGNRFILYSKDMNIDVCKDVNLEKSIRRAIDKREFSLLYQPIFDLESETVSSLEALIRWDDPSSADYYMPATFIPFCEKSGLIIPVGEWVIRQACRQNKLWQDKGLSKVPVSVNLSAVQFRDENLVDIVKNALKESGLEPHFLEIEVTETALVDDYVLAKEKISQLKQMGVKISIDDFGTGYSSLIYLKKFNIDTLKIDKSFIDELPGCSEDAAIVSAVIGLCRSLNLKTVAEGVETAIQARFLQEKFCDTAQGFYYSKPVSASKIESFLDKNIFK